jgi:multicomponent Na+:H+ antiporter subunit A
VLLLLLGVLTVTTLTVPVIARPLGRATGWPVALVLALAAVWVSVQGLHLWRHDRALEASLPWMPALGVGLDLRMDGLAWLFCVLVLGVGALVTAYSARYFPPGRRTGFYVLMSTFALAMTGLVLADDVVLLFVFWELTTICSFSLIGLSGPKGARPAVRTFLLTALGGLALLAAVVLLWVRTGTTRLSEILGDLSWTQDTAFTSAVAVLVVIAVFTKSAQFPFHYWLPDAMAASTPVSAYLHAAAMVKAGVYLAMRFSPAFAGTPVWGATLVVAGLATAVLGAALALRCHDLKELTAYSTVSQLGFLVAVIGVGTPQALIAAAVHTLAHALFKSTLFMAVGVIDRQTGTRDLRELGGLARTMPVTATVSALAALSMAGVPPLLGFVSKENVFEALLEAPGPAWAGPAAGAVAVVAASLTFAYAVRFVYLTFGGRPARRPGQDSAPGRVREADALFLAAPVLTAAAGLALGSGVAGLNPVIAWSAGNAALAPASPHLALWHGPNPALAMSGAALLLGALLTWRSSCGERVAGYRLPPVRGTAVFEGAHAGVVALGTRVGDLTRTDAPTRHLAAPIVLLLVLAAVVPALGLDFGLSPAPTSRALDWLLVALVAVAVLTAAVTRSRMAALALVGVSGFATALWFVFLGAIDVALTQLLVETLTVVVAVLVLRRLPRRFHRVRRSRTAVTAAIALAAGTAAGLGAYLLTGRREHSAVSDYLLANAPDDTGGTNVVNTVLVDYRPLDTLGELTVLGVAGLIIIAVLRSAGLTAGGEARPRLSTANPVWDADDNTVVMRTVARRLIPFLVLWSLYLLMRGHNAPGGGFIAGLVGGSAFALAYLAAPSASAARIRLAYPAIIAAGVVVAVATGLLGYAEGTFLRPLHAEIPLPWGGYYHFTTALVFDVGVYLAVVGVLLTALNQLGLPRPAPTSPPGPEAHRASRPVRHRSATGGAR